MLFLAFGERLFGLWLIVAFNWLNDSPPTAGFIHSNSYYAVFQWIGTAQIQKIWNNVDFQVVVDLCATEWNVPMKHKSCIHFSSFKQRHNKRMQTDNFEKCLQNTNIFVSLHMAAVEMEVPPLSLKSLSILFALCTWKWFYFFMIWAKVAKFMIHLYGETNPIIKNE